MYPVPHCEAYDTFRDIEIIFQDGRIFCIKMKLYTFYDVKRLIHIVFKISFSKYFRLFWLVDKITAKDLQRYSVEYLSQCLLGRGKKKPVLYK